MSYVFVNGDMKFLKTSEAQTHGGARVCINWVDKDNAEVFKTDNLPFELKIRKGTPLDIREVSSNVVGSFKVELIRTVKILKEQP